MVRDFLFFSAFFATLRVALQGAGVSIAWTLASDQGAKANLLIYAVPSDQTIPCSLFPCFPVLT